MGWANSQSKIVPSSLGAWDQRGSFADYYRAYTLDLMRTESTLEATLVIDLIDLKRKDLARRLYLEQQFVAEGSIWTKVLGKISKGFETYPASKKEIEEKKGTSRTPT